MGRLKVADNCQGKEQIAELTYILSRENREYRLGFTLDQKKTSEENHQPLCTQIMKYLYYVFP